MDSSWTTAVNRILTTIAVVLALSTGADAETLYSRHGWWKVASDTLQTGEVVCQASTTYTGGTFLGMAAKYSDGGERVWGLYLSNPEWKWIRNETDYNVSLYAPSGVRAITLRSNVSDHSLFAFVDKEVINALAMDRSGSVTVLAGNRTLGTFRLDDSAAAIRDVVHCLRANPPVKPTARPSEKKQETGPSSGTGFFVADGSVLTNYHVIKGCTRRISVAYPNHKPEDAYNAGIDETNDLALLRTKMPNRGTAEFRYQPKLGEPVAAYGFPLGQILATEENFTLGNVTSVAGLGGDSRHFQISAPVQPGSSGGPVLDASGRVTGIAMSSLDTLKMVNITGQVPQNVNFAISASIAINFLTIKDVTPKISSTAVAEKLEPEKLAEVAKRFTVQVSCE
jgi:S1-C subfamily serine protease